MSDKNLIPTAHIAAKKEQVAKFVIMPGDPLRAKYIAQNYLQDVEQINSVRNMLMFTGKYKGHLVTIASSGMGTASMGIYAYELFKFYDVDCILRIGSAGSYKKEVNIFDIINVEASYSESTFAKYATGFKENIIKSSEEIKDLINKVAQKDNIKIKVGLIHTTETFYPSNVDDWKVNSITSKCLAVEMESFALFAVAGFLKKLAGCLVTISDSFISKETISSNSREVSFNKMMVLALDSALTFYEESK